MNSVIEYIDFIYEKLNEFMIEQISYSDYMKITDWLDEIREQVEQFEKKQAPMKPMRKEKNLYCSNCNRWLLWDDAIPNDDDNYCPNCGQKIDWSEEDEQV